MLWYDQALEKAEAAWRLVRSVDGDWKALARKRRGLNVLDDHHELLVRSLWTAKQVQFRRLLWVHSLAKLSRPEVDSLALREPGAKTGVGWTARSFASDVLVRFRDRNKLQSIFGKTPDLYNAGFLLKAHRLERDLPNVGNRRALGLVCDLLEWIEADTKSAKARAEAVFLCAMCLLYTDAERAGAAASARMSTSTPTLLWAAKEALRRKSGGEFHMSFVAAGLGSHRFERVERAHRNTAGTVGGRLVRLGDVQCFIGEEVVVAAEVKARVLTIHDLESSLDEATDFTGSFLIFCEGIAAGDEAEIAARLRRADSEMACHVVVIPNAATWVMTEIAMLSPADSATFADRVSQLLREHAGGSEYEQEWRQLLAVAASTDAL